MKYYGFITVRTGSSRLKKKCLLKFGKFKILDHIILRAKKSNITPILCTTHSASDNVLETIAKKRNIKVFRGSINNKIKRWRDCADKFKIDYFHTIDADDVFFDPISVKKSIKLCRTNYDIIYPSKISRDGGASEGYSFSYGLIDRINNNIKKNYKNFYNLDTEMIEKFIDRKKFKVKIFNGLSYQIKNVRLTLDYVEDYKMLKKVRNKCGNFASRKKINFFLKKNYDVVKINYFRTIDWKKKQLRKLQM